MEPWEKVLVDSETFPQTDHGQIGCVECHGGQQDPDKETAHLDLDPRPSAGQASVCAECHESQVELQSVSLHATQQGYWTVLEGRGASAEHPEMQEMFGNHCASCHTSCGDCHISQPTSVGGGLLDGHNIVGTPPMSRTCTACHGSRVGNEFLGKNEGEDLKPDVHFRMERMVCTDCHTADEMHGDVESETGAPVAHRYEGLEEPKCTNCHLSIADSNMYHEAHGDTLSCQVCHSVAYSSCDSCHVAVSESSGQPFFETSAHYLTFLIGRNPRQSEERPYEYVPVRHVPIDPDSFAFYGEDLLPEFDAEPTWRYATPHNIQLETPQTETCNSCHGNADIFLTADKVAPEELDANQPVIIDAVPEQR